jgi:hypothetical protein
LQELRGIVPRERSADGRLPMTLLLKILLAAACGLVMVALL